MSLAGCVTPAKDKVRTKSETEIAVSAIRAEWLTDCVFEQTPEQENQVGGLLQDYVDMAEALALCMKRHNDFVGYMRPIVQKERTAK